MLKENVVGIENIKGILFQLNKGIASTVGVGQNYTISVIGNYSYDLLDNERCSCHFIVTIKQTVA